MSNDEFEKKHTEQRAAHMLMVDFVKSNPELLATVMEPIIAVSEDVSYETLKDSMGVVSQVFAGIALELIDHNSLLDPDDSSNMSLPVGAKVMNSTIDELSKFINSLHFLFVLFINKNFNHPAIEMVRNAFYKYEAQM